MYLICLFVLFSDLAFNFWWKWYFYSSLFLLVLFYSVSCYSCFWGLALISKSIFYREKGMCCVKMYKQESDALSVIVWRVSRFSIERDRKLVGNKNLDVLAYSWYEFWHNILAQIFKVFYSRALGFFASSFRRVLLFSKIKAGCLNMGKFLCMPACLLMKCAIFYLFLGLFSFGLSRGEHYYCCYYYYAFPWTAVYMPTIF